MIDINPIKNDSPDKPFTAGENAFDFEEQISYRILKELDPQQGWASSYFWQDRWNCEHKDLISFVQAGLLDAAALEGSLYRRYRCRDERVLKTSVHWKMMRRRITLVKFSATRAKRKRS